MIRASTASASRIGTDADSPPGGRDSPAGQPADELFVRKNHAGMPMLGQGAAQLVGVPAGPGAQDRNVHPGILSSRRQGGSKTRLYGADVDLRPALVRRLDRGANLAMKKILSKDGTAIAVERTGRGPALVFVDGAMCYRASGPSQPMAAALAEHFTVFTYDRRGRGDSSDSGPYDVQREVDDLDAVIREAGGQAFVLGVSSGAALALEAASRGVPITRLALYEAPFIVDDSRPALSDDFVPQMNAALAAGRRADAVKMFMKLVGVPGIFIMLMRVMPAWPKLTAIAHTLPYDLAIVGPYQKGRPLPTTRWSRRDNADAGDGWREEPGVDAKRDACAGRCAAERHLPHARRTDAHGQAEGARAAARRVLQPKRAYSGLARRRTQSSTRTRLAARRD